MILHRPKLWAVPCLSGRSLPSRLQPHARISGLLGQKFVSTLNTAICEWAGGALPAPQQRRRTVSEAGRATATSVTAGFDLMWRGR
jgi:hypothetical protein